jgi:hypothetical protein
VDVGGRESQQPITGIEQEVLAAVVLDEPVAMVGPVVLDDEPRRWVIEIGPAYESISGVVEIGLDLRSRQARLE